MASFPNRISRLSTQPIWVPVRIEHPISGPEDLSGATAEISIARGVKPGTFSAATIDVGGTWEAPDGKDYYIVEGDVAGDSLAVGKYEVWVRVVHNTYTYVINAGSIDVY